METSAREEAHGEQGPAATQLDVSRLRSSSMEIREKGSEFLKEELHRAQKVGARGGRGPPGELWALTECPEISCTYLSGPTVCQACAGYVGSPHKGQTSSLSDF